MHSLGEHISSSLRMFNTFTSFFHTCNNAEVCTNNKHTYGYTQFKHYSLVFVHDYTNVDMLETTFSLKIVSRYMHFNP